MATCAAVLTRVVSRTSCSCMRAVTARHHCRAGLCSVPEPVGKIFDLFGDLPELQQVRTLVDAGKPDQAISPLIRVIEISTAAFGESHDATAALCEMLAGLHFRSGDLGTCESWLYKAATPSLPENSLLLASMQLMRGRAEKALETLGASAQDTEGQQQLVLIAKLAMSDLAGARAVLDEMSGRSSETRVRMNEAACL